MEKLLFLSVLLMMFSVVAFADNVVTYTYDSAGNRTTKIVSAPAQSSGSGSQPSSPSTQLEEGVSQSTTQSE